MVSPVAENSCPFSSLVASSSPVQPSRSNTYTHVTGRRLKVDTSGLGSSGRTGSPHLLHQLAAQRDVGAAEDVSHVSRDAQVVLFIRLWYLKRRKWEYMNGQTAFFRVTNILKGAYKVEFPAQRSEIALLRKRREGVCQLSWNRKQTRRIRTFVESSVRFAERRTGAGSQGG